MLLIGITIFLILCILIYRSLKKVDYTFSEYESELFSYFTKIALKAEYGYHPNRIIKWKKPMKLFVFLDEENEAYLKIVEEVVRDINELVSDGFKISLTDYSVNADAIIHVVNKDRMMKMDKCFMDGINEDFSGLAEVFFSVSNSYLINKAKIFVDIDEPFERHRAIILEELTQALGLLNDTFDYGDSVFFQNKTSENPVEDYSLIDKDIIQLLYHPKIKPGYNVRQIERVFKRLLKNNQIVLFGQQISKIKS